MDFRVRTLGGLAIERDGRPLAGGATQPRRLAVLALLARAGPRGLTRDRLVALLWPEADEERARRALSQALYALRQELGSEEVILGVQDLRLNPDLVGSDVTEFEAALADGRLAEAAAGYGGPFLDGFHLSGSPDFERWVEEERPELARRYTETLERLAKEATAQGDRLGAVTWWRKLAGLDPLNSRIALGLMEALAGAGDRGGAIQHARVYELLVQESLGIPPDPEVVALTQQLRQEAAAPRAPVSVTPPAAAPEPSMPQPPGRTPGALPHELTSFIGRERELAEIKQLLMSTRLLTLTGPGGCGKTRLGQAAAVAVREEFRDGVWWAELAPLADPQLVPQAVATAFGIGEAPGRSLTETLAEHLSGKNALLVLDNCEHLVASCAGLAEVLLRAAPGLRILTTSRQPLNTTGEHAWPVPSLSLPDARRTPSPVMLAEFDAVRLFTERAAAVTGSFTLTEENGPAVARVCRRLDGIPLAIELAAARARVLSVEQMGERLDDCFALLTAGSRTALPRHRTLRATMDWSYELLAEEERCLFARLSVFAGGFTLNAVEAVCVGDGVRAGEALDLLARLVEKSLVVVEDEPGAAARYRLLEPVRQYAREKLRTSGEDDAVRRRHAGYFGSLAAEGSPELRGPNQGVWLARLDREQDNLRSAMAWLLGQGELEAAVGLGWSLWLFWWMRAHFHEGRRWMEEALAQGLALPPLTRARALFIAGTMADGQAHYDEAQPLLAESLRTFQELEDKSGIAFASGSAGFVAVAQGRHDQGIALLEQSRAHFLQLGESWGAALMLSFLGAVWRARGDRAQARRLAEQGLAESRAAGDTHGIGVALYVLAGVAQDEGDHERAERLFAEGLERSADTGEDANVAYCLEGLAAVAAARGRVDRAARLWGAAEALLERAHATPYIYIPDRSVYQREVSGARARLDQEAFAAAWVEGRAMAVGDAIAYALAPEPAAPALPETAASGRAAKRLGWRSAAAVMLLAAGGAAAFLVHSDQPRPIVPGNVRRLAFGPGLELDPALAPNGRLLAFSAESAGTMRLFVKQVAGGREVRPAADFPRPQRWPRWSPDGSEIAFQSEGAIYVVPALGGSARALVRPESPEDWTAYPAWSPDGQELAFVRDWKIYTRSIRGGPARQIAVSRDVAHSLAWSPDGEWIALVEGNPSFVFGSEPWGTTINLGNAAPSSIWVMPARGGEPIRVTHDSSLNTSPVWLPHGRALLFISDRDGDRDVYQVHLDARRRPRGAPARITAGLGAHTIALSGDGRRLAYAVFGHSSNLHWLPLSGGAPVPVSEARPLTTGSQAIEGVDLSPDGQWLAFDSDRNGNHDIFKMPATGGDPVQLTSAPADEFMSSWSPDGREIAFYSVENGTRQLQIVSSDGGRPSSVAARPRNQRFPGWSPDGRALVFSSTASGRMELYVTSRSSGGQWAEPRRLTSGGGAAGRWSPRGDEIAFVRSDGLWAIAPEGGSPRQVLRIDPLRNPAPLVVQWSPDGGTLYYKAFDDRGRSSIWSLPAAGGEPRPLVQFDDSRHRSTRPEFATDGRRVYFTISEHRADIWMMELSGR